MGISEGWVVGVGSVERDGPPEVTLGLVPPPLQGEDLSDQLVVVGEERVVVG